MIEWWKIMDFSKNLLKLNSLLSVGLMIWKVDVKLRKIWRDLAILEDRKMISRFNNFMQANHELKF